MALNRYTRSPLRKGTTSRVIRSDPTTPLKTRRRRDAVDGELRRGPRRLPGQENAGAGPHQVLEEVGGLRQIDGGDFQDRALIVEISA